MKRYHGHFSQGGQSKTLGSIIASITQEEVILKEKRVHLFIRFLGTVQEKGYHNQSSLLMP